MSHHYPKDLQTSVYNAFVVAVDRLCAFLSSAHCSRALAIAGSNILDR